MLLNLQKDTAISMNVKSAWRVGYTGKGVLVAVVDDGVAHHPDLVSNFVSIFINYYGPHAYIMTTEKTSPLVDFRILYAAAYFVTCSPNSFEIGQFRLLICTKRLRNAKRCI